jgi:tetratricopeptide (TPR) repeat protein
MGVVMKNVLARIFFSTIRALLILFIAFGLQSRLSLAEEKEQPKTEVQASNAAQNAPGDPLVAIEKDKSAPQGDSEMLLKKMQSLNTRLAAKAVELYVKLQEANQAKKECEKLKALTGGMNDNRINIEKKNQALEEEAASLRKQILGERAKLYQELGTAYTEAKHFDQAINAYQKSLEANAANAQVYYNLGLLYKHAKGDNQKSLKCFKKYLQVAPAAENKAEVEYLIKMLSE